jgi:hypothetical protein
VEYSVPRAFSKKDDPSKSVHGLSTSMTTRQARFTQASEENMFASANLTNYPKNEKLANKRVKKQVLKNYGLGLAQEVVTQQNQAQNLQESVLVNGQHVTPEVVETKTPTSSKVNGKQTIQQA